MGMIQDLLKMDKERRGEVASMRAEADAFVNDLAKGSAQRRSDVATMKRDLAKADAERRSEVAAMLSEADAFVKDLAKADAERASEVATMRAETDAMVDDLTKGSAERASEVATMLSEADAFVKDLAKGSAERHTMVWGGVAPARKVAAPPKVAPPVAEKAPAGELRDSVFAYLAGHPDGTKLVELEAEFGVTRIEMARMVRELMDDNLVEKRDLLYFAI